MHVDVRDKYFLQCMTKHIVHFRAFHKSRTARLTCRLPGPRPETNCGHTYSSSSPFSSSSFSSPSLRMNRHALRTAECIVMLLGQVAVTVKEQHGAETLSPCLLPRRQYWGRWQLKQGYDILTELRFSCII